MTKRKSNLPPTIISQVIALLKDSDTPLRMIDITEQLGVNRKSVETAMRKQRNSKVLPRIYVAQWIAKPKSVTPVYLFGDHQDAVAPMTRIGRTRAISSDAKDRERRLLEASRDIEALIPTLLPFRGNPFAPHLAYAGAHA